MSKSMLFLTILFVAIIGYSYFPISSPNLITAGIFEGAAVTIVFLYAALKLRGTSEKKHNYSSPRGVKKEKSKKNPFF